MILLFKQWATKLNSFFRKISKDEIKWEEFEAEIDAQVDAVFNVAAEMDDFTDANGIVESFKMRDSPNLFSGYKAINELNEKMKKRRELQKRVRFPKLFFMLVFLVSLLIAHFLVPRGIYGAKKSVDMANKTHSLVKDFIALVNANFGGGDADSDGGVGGECNATTTAQ